MQLTEEAPATADSPLADMLTCGKCHALNSHKAEICIECGAWLEGPDGESPKERKLAASHALREAYKWISGVTWLYRLGTLGYGLAMVGAVLGLATPEVPLGGGVLVVVLTTLLAVLMLMGALQILFRPLTWALIIASLATVVTVVHLVGPNPFGVAFVVSGALALLAWGAVFPITRFHRLIEEHKDLYILHHASSQTQRSLRGRTVHDRHHRLLGVMRRAARRAWKISALSAGALVAISLLGTTAVVNKLRSEDFETMRAGFEEAWNANDLKLVNEFFDPRVRVREDTWLRGSLDAYGWDGELPDLKQGELTLEEERATVTYWLGDLAGTARWIKTAREWHLESFDLPNPPFDPALEAFLEAWRKSDPRALSSFYSKENQKQMLASFKNSMKIRDWDPLPKVRKYDVGDYVARQLILTLSLDEGDVVTRWHLRPDASWGLHGLALPER